MAGTPPPTRVFARPEPAVRPSTLRTASDEKHTCPGKRKFEDKLVKFAMKMIRSGVDTLEVDTPEVDTLEVDTPPTPPTTSTTTTRAHTDNVDGKM
jgi:hypothetical protein